MADFDIENALRRARFDTGDTLSRRADAQLPFATARDVAGPPVLLDTCVYIDQMQARTPELIEALIDTRQVNHSAVAIQELMHTIGVLDPRDPRTANVVSKIRYQVEGMPAHRTFVPDADVLGRAALMAGVLCRLRGYKVDAKFKALHDAVLFLQALKLGFTILTANIVEFDFLLQLQPMGRVLFYRR